MSAHMEDLDEEKKQTAKEILEDMEQEWDARFEPFKINDEDVPESHFDMYKTLLTAYFRLAVGGDADAEKELDNTYRPFLGRCYQIAGRAKYDRRYHDFIAVKDYYQKYIATWRCANNRHELKKLKNELNKTTEMMSQQMEESKRELTAKQEHLTEDNARLKQQLEESKASNAEQLRSKHEVLLRVIKDQVEKQERLTEDNARMKQQLEESNADKNEMGCKLQLMLEVIKELTERQEHVIEENARMKKEVKEISQKLKDISTVQKVFEEDVRMKNPKETFTEGREKESE